MPEAGNTGPGLSRPANSYSARVAPPLLGWRGGAGHTGRHPNTLPGNTPSPDSGVPWMNDRSATEPLRRTPSQHRSRVRVERILDAAGDLIAERGYEAITTSLIARRARVSPGSFYQFFADKRAVVQALSARNLALYGERLNAAMAERSHAHWWDVVETALGTYVQLCRALPRFRAVRFGDIVDVHLLDNEEDNDSVVAGHLASLLSSRFQLTDTPELRLALVVAVKIADALVRFAFTREAQGDENVLNQARQVLRSHLEAHVPGSLAEAAS
jgi:AcrR family transcriptional regulator